MTSDLTAQYVLAALPRGRDNARSLGDLAEALHLLRRSVEASVQALRLEGWPREQTTLPWNGEAA